MADRRVVPLGVLWGCVFALPRDKIHPMHIPKRPIRRRGFWLQLVKDSCCVRSSFTSRDLSCKLCREGCSRFKTSRPWPPSGLLKGCWVEAMVVATWFKQALGPSLVAAPHLPFSSTRHSPHPSSETSQSFHGRIPEPRESTAMYIGQL